MASVSGVVRLAELFRHEAAPPTPLGIPVGEVISIAFTLGRIAVGLEGQLRPSALLASKLPHIPELMHAGWRALDNWPDGFTTLLDTRRVRVTTARGVKQAFGPLSLQVHRWAREPWGAPIGKAFAEYATSQPDISLSVRRLAQYAPGLKIRQTHVSVLHAAEEIGISPGLAMEMVKRLGLLVLAPQGGGVPSLLKVSDVRSLKTALRNCVDLEAVKRLLGTDYEKTTELERAELVRNVPPQERLMVSRPFLASQVKMFLKQCLSNAPKMSAAQADEMGLKRLSRCTSAGYSLSDVCRALSEGRLRPRADVIGAHGLHRIRIDFDEMRVSTPGGRATLSLVEAAKTLKAGHIDLTVWIRRGFLTATTSTVAGERGVRIRRTDWAEFRSAYLAGTDLEGLFDGHGGSWVTRHLLHVGVQPVSGPKIDGTRACLYRRSDCSPEVLRKFHALRAGPDRGHREGFRLAFEKVIRVARYIEKEWGADFKRTNNFFEDRRSGRALHVIVGSRKGIRDAFRFSLHQRSIARLSSRPHAFIALVPSQGGTFILAPLEELNWTGTPGRTQDVGVKFDVHGRPVQYASFVRFLDDERAQ